MTEPLSHGLTVLMAALLIVGAIGGLQWPVDAAIVIALGVTVLNWRRLAPIARVFAAGAFAVIAGFFLLAPDRADLLRTALAQGANFAALLAMLGVIRYPVRRSGTVGRAAAWLLAFPRASRYAAINFGSHFLSLLFNIGIVPMISDLTRQDNRAIRGIEEAERQSLVMAGMRGMVLMTVWSPMGVGFAIVVTAVGGLNPVYFLALAFATAMVMLLVTCIVEVRHGRAAPPPDMPVAAVRGSPTPLIVVLIACAGLLMLTIVLHEWAQISFVAATILVLPVASVLWLWLERGPQRVPLSAELGEMLAGIGQMRTESAIFLSASVIAAAVSLLIREQDFWRIIEGGEVPGMAIVLFCLIAVPVAGALYIPHSILVVTFAQLFGSSPAGAQYPMALALSLTLGWAMAIAVSPISAATLITGNLCKVPSSTIGLDWNRRFVFTLGAISCVVLIAVYAAESWRAAL